jgi:hypothetical protein
LRFTKKPDTKESGFTTTASAAVFAVFTTADEAAEDKDERVSIPTPRAFVALVRSA